MPGNIFEQSEHNQVSSTMSDQIEVEPQPAGRPASQGATTETTTPLEPLEVQELNDDQNYPTGAKFYAVMAALLLTMLPVGLV